MSSYLFCGALIKSIDDGIVNRIDPGKPESRNVVEVMDSGEHVDKIPLNLYDALEALKDDEVVRSALPGKLYNLYDMYKRDEWTRMLREVTNWDVEMYLDCLP